jgi:hypothetical protein
VIKMTLPTFALMLSVAASFTPPESTHECGKGPVTLRMAVGGCCAAPQPTPRLERVTGDLYAMVPETTTINAVCMPCDPIEQRWSDWPECGGKEIPLTETDLR